MGIRALTQTWPAPAKLNLFLHVLGRRPDGYHELQTVFQFLDRADELRFRVTADPRIRRLSRHPHIPPHQDLAVRAAQALQAAAGIRHGVDIELIKHIPLGGGLGGGSSDAATTLVALNLLWDAGLDETVLLRLGLELGADVPVFIKGVAAWAEGIGELLCPVDLPEPWYVVLAPPVHVATAEIFADPQLTRHSRPITIRDFRAGRVRNDLEAVVRQRYPEVDATMNWLSEFGHAGLTGSGACVFVAVSGREEGERILARRPEGSSGFVARGLNRSPLLDFAERVG